MGATFEQIDVFPIIARLIESRHVRHGGFVTSRELAEALVEDAEGHRIVEEAQRRQSDAKSLEWTASNMVAWFGQRITARESNWQNRFLREKIDGLWAYIPVNSSHDIEKDT